MRAPTPVFRLLCSNSTQHEYRMKQFLLIEVIRLPGAIAKGYVDADLLVEDVWIRGF